LYCSCGIVVHIIVKYLKFLTDDGIFFFISIFCRFSCSSYHKCTYWLCQMVVLLIIDYLNFPRDYFIFSIFGFWSFTKIERWTFLDMSLYFSGNRVVLLAAVSQNCSEKTIKFYVNTLYFPYLPLVLPLVTAYTSWNRWLYFPADDRIILFFYI
jgi:hypothetical protein